MELSWLETFTVLAESSSMRTAAAKLGISPATASERILALEDELGTQLLIRSSRGSELSEAGKLYASSAKQLIQNWNNILDLIKPIDNKPFQRLSIGLPDHLIIPALGRFLDSFLAAYPQIELNMYSDVETGIDTAMNNNSVDIFFAFEPVRSIRQGRTVRLVHQTRMGVLLPSDHRLAFRKSVSMRDLEGETLVLYPSTHDSSLHDLQIEMLKSSGIRYLEYGGHFSPSLYALTAKMGCGIVLLPRVMAKGTPPKTVFLNLDDDSCKCGIYMIYNPSNNNPVLKKFLNEFGDQIGVDET